RTAALRRQEPLSRRERTGGNDGIFRHAKWRLGSRGRGHFLQRAEQPRPALSSHRTALSESVFHADFFAVRARVAFLEPHRCHEGRAPPLSPRGAAVCDADTAHRAPLYEETRRHAIRFVQPLDCGDLRRNIFLPVAVDRRTGLGSPRAEGGNPPRGEDPFAPGFLRVLRAYGFSLVVALACVAIVGAVTRAASSRRAAGDIVTRNLVHGDGSRLAADGAQLAAQDFEHGLDTRLAECGQPPRMRATDANCRRAER